MNITISGASGLIGRRLLKLLAKDGHSLHALSRHAGTNLPPGVRLAVWDAGQGRTAGRRPARRRRGDPPGRRSRWRSAGTRRRSRRIRESRVAGTRNLVAALAQACRASRQTLICASAIGYYGSRGDEVLAESAAPGNDYLAEVCVAWEKEAQAAEALGMRVVRVRIGVVLDARGGALHAHAAAVPHGRGRETGQRQTLDVVDSSGRPGGPVSVRAGESAERRVERSGAEPGHQCRFHARAGGGGAPSGHPSRCRHSRCACYLAR